MNDNSEKGISSMPDPSEFFAPPIAESIAWAAQLHRDQRDKAGKDYILHPLRVMLQFDDLRRQTASILHDVKEDCAVTDEMLMERGYCPLTLGDLDSLTRRKDESYEAFIDRFIREGSLEACEVKLKDLNDNMRPDRALPPSPEGDARMERYMLASGRLMAHVMLSRRSLRPRA